MYGKEKKETETRQVTHSGSIPEGFFQFFQSDAEVPDAPASREQQMRFDELGISLHYCFALTRLGIGTIKTEDLEAVDRELQALKLFHRVGEADLNVLRDLDHQVFFPGEMNCSRMAYGPFEVTIGPLLGNTVLEPKTYLVVTVHNEGLVTLTLTANVTNTVKADLYADQVQSLEDAYFYDKQIFKIGGKQTALADFFKQLRTSLARVFPDLQDFRALKYVSVSVKKTTPPFENARQFAAKHAYEMIAMLGEEADWRQTEKTTVREILACGLQSKVDDVVVAQEFASVALDGSPDQAQRESFGKFGVLYQQVLDIHALAAWTGFNSMRRLLDAQIQACTEAVERHYQGLIRENNRLLSRYLRIKQSFTNVDHIWKDAAFAQCANFMLELYTATKKAARRESFDAVMDTLRALTAQMMDVVQRQSESRTNLALQLVSLFLSGAAILDLVKLAGDAYNLHPLSQFLIGSAAWTIVALLVLLFAFGRWRELIRN